ncbi:unannotated protein [freshwater metagenome]|uniref:Unannotated protein n=1 Tax=freshwater metagenome TaxID=449393 RepID=A0A6J6DPT8_9ZZZZ
MVCPLVKRSEGISPPNQRKTISLGPSVADHAIISVAKFAQAGVSEPEK